MKPYVTLEILEKVGYIEFFNHPHNALTPSLLNDLTSLINSAAVDNKIHIIVLKSGGDRAFCAGASFNHMVEISDEAEGKSFFMGFANVINALRKCPKIIIGSIQGKAVGGGVGLASAVDICFATEFADIKLSELSVGIGPFVIEPAIKRKIGVSAMSQLALKAQTFFSAKWAMDKGLYANVFESNKELIREVQSLASELSSYNIDSLAAFKRIQWQGTDDWDKLLESRAQLSGKMSLSPKAKSYLKKFI
ncbi:MAG: enoyl-CoA hydratase/isomerase family protein [Flavobacteriaceae bacterium]